MVVFNPSIIFKTGIFLAFIRSVASAPDRYLPVDDKDITEIHVKDLKLAARSPSNPVKVAVQQVEDQHLQNFCTTWLGFPNYPTVTTITATTTSAYEKQATKTVSEKKTVVMGKITKTVSTTVTNSVTSTVSKETITSVLATNDVTSVAATQTITSVVATVTVTSAVGTNFVTSVVGTVTQVSTTVIVVPTTSTTTTTYIPNFTQAVTAAPKARRGDVSPDSLRKRHDRDPRRRTPDCFQWTPDDVISSACSSAIAPKNTKTVTKTTTIATTTVKGTTTITVYTATATIPADTATVTLTSTKSAVVSVTATTVAGSTKVNVISSTATITVSSTSTVTVPSTIISTITSTATTATIETATSTTVLLATATATRCPSVNRVTGANGISVGSSGGKIQILQGTASVEDCCIACYDPAKYGKTCNLWAAGPGYCFIGYSIPGQNPSASCPAGMGNGQLFATPSDSTALGGPGPCAGSGFSVVN